MVALFPRSSLRQEHASASVRAVDEVNELKASALDVFSAPVFIMRNGEIAYANRACCQAFGLAHQREIIGHHILDRLSDVQPDGLAKRQSLDSFNAIYKAQGFVRRMWSFKKLDDSATIIRSTVVRIPNEAARCSVAIVDDLDAFAAEHALQQSALRALAADGTVKSVSDRLSLTATDLIGGARSLAGSSERATAMLRKALGTAHSASTGTTTISRASQALSRSIEQVAALMLGRKRDMHATAARAQEVTAAIRGLSAAAARIGEVVGLVGACATQTQLLALNATIEAARAGEGGRGFAVVAAEVKTLATQSERASREVGAQTAAIRTMVQQASVAVAEIAASFEDLRRDIDDLVADVDQQRSATQDINHHVQQSASAAVTLEQLINDLLCVVQDNDAMSFDLLDRSHRLQEEADTLQREVSGYSHQPDATTGERMIHAARPAASPTP